MLYFIVTFFNAKCLPYMTVVYYKILISPILFQFEKIYLNNSRMNIKTTPPAILFILLNRIYNSTYQFLLAIHKCST